MPAQPPFARAWLAQRVAAADAVAQVERAELRALTEEEALRLADALLAAVPSPVSPGAELSGFVEQQRLFALARSRS